MTSEYMKPNNDNILTVKVKREHRERYGNIAESTGV